MKSTKLLLLLAVGFSPAALLVSGCSKSDDTSATAANVKADAKDTVADVKATAVDSWDSVKDYTFEKRAEFSASFDRMTAKLDEKASAAKAKASGAPDAASKEYDEARAELKTKLSDLGNATADTWADAKAKVAESWKRVKAASDKTS